MTGTKMGLRALAGLTAGAALAAGIIAPSSAEAQSGSTKAAGVNGWRSERLAEELKGAVLAQRFQDVLDTIPVTTPGRVAALAAGQEKGYEPQPGEVRRRSLAAAAEPKLIHQMPNIDLSVIELNTAGRPVAAADVILSPQYPKGKIVPLDKNMATDQVRWRRWDDATWDNNGAQGTVDAIPGRENAPIDFMSPYPASVIKLMVAFGVLQLVDKGEAKLDEPYFYDPTGQPNKACGDMTNKTLNTLFQEMILVSSNEATCTLIKFLHQHDAVDPLNKRFAELGLPMLQLIGTRKVDGGRWIDMQMSAMDTAKLLLIFNGSPGTLWTVGPKHAPITADVLHPESREYIMKLLHGQGINQVLSTPNWCGRTYPAPGIPQKIGEYLAPAEPEIPPVPADPNDPTKPGIPGKPATDAHVISWIDPATGTVTVGRRKYNQDVRPCQAAAEVTFAHKPGLVDTSANDAGIVKNLPGKNGRHYIVVIHSNIGDRYIDINRPADPPGTFAVPITDKYSKLGKVIDDLIACH